MSAGMLKSLASSPSTLESFAAVCSQVTCPRQYPLASSIQRNIPIYNLPSWQNISSEQHVALQQEWNHCLLNGPGVFVAKRLYMDHGMIDKATAVFYDIIQREKVAGASHGDHFAGAGKNDRIWNSFGKHCIEDPASFAAYYSNPWLAYICASWLGPGYRITAQANNVRPGGKAQVSHRDYHLGFMSRDRCMQYPRAVQIASQLLTLQGAVAHVDVPEESGPTRLLPYSQNFEQGYVTYQLPEFDRYFTDHYVSLPLEKGDGIFFNPALFHAAGTNQSAHINRMVNLLQVSSAFGKTMESLDSLSQIKSCWGSLIKLYHSKGRGPEVEALVAALGDGYAFPTNLDHHEPQAGSMSPLSEQDVIWNALEAHATEQDVSRDLEVYTARRRA
ncbi:hypothetical protein HJFPF1_07169 [Paramyrothecium foliicola]|nr:hypothetical protein HJFPF1_07169 [Paramyrothecium foliicola]